MKKKLLIFGTGGGAKLAFKKIKKKMMSIFMDLLNFKNIIKRKLT